IRKLYGPAVEPLMAHVDEVLGHARRMVEPLPENPLHRAFERRAGGDRRKADRALLGPSVRAPAGVTAKPAVETVPAAVATKLVVEPVPLPAPDRRFSDEDLPTVRTRALRGREIPMPSARPTTNGNQISQVQVPVNGSHAIEDESPARAAIRG